MLKPSWRILIVAVLCIAFLIGMVVREGAARSGGQEVTLAMAAVDPRALLSGHYVIIDPRAPLAAGEACPAIPEGARWIALASDGAHHRPVGAALTREAALALGPIAVRGELTCFPPPAAGEGSPAIPGQISADVGVYRYYAAQAEAQRIEAMLREQAPGEPTRIYAILSIGADGRARLKGLLVDERRLELGWL